MKRNILITGGNNGIGLAMTQSLLEKQDRVAVIDLSLENLPHPQNLLKYECDVTKPEQIHSVIDDIVDHWGSVDILVNNACLALFTRFEDRSVEDIRREFEVNYFGALNLIREVLPVMKKQGHGVIHNVSSGVGFTGMPGMIGYTSTKGAIESMTRTLALEYSHTNITFNVIHPPLTHTKSAAGFGIPDEMMADPKTVGYRLARLVGKANPILAAGFINNVQLYMSYHMRVQMGKLMSNFSDKARHNKKESPY